MAGPTRTSDYDRYAVEYAAYVATREQHGLDADPFGMLSHILVLLGDVANQDVLDAGCGEGYLARILAARGARVTGVESRPARRAGTHEAVSPGHRLPGGRSERALPDLAGRFDAVASYFVLNDVEEYRGFARTLARSLKPGGRAVLGFNNPYDYVLRKGRAQPTSPPAPRTRAASRTSGVPVSFYHRTLPQYLTPSWMPACT